MKHDECSEVADAHRAAAIIECRAMSGAGSVEAETRVRPSWILAATAVVAIVRLLTRQATHWEFDEYLFRLGIESFDPLRHHPHPPGYPLLVGLGKALTAIAGDPFVALLVLAWLSSVVGVWALATAVRSMTGSESVAVVAALLFHLSPAMLVHGPEPMSDAPALMFLSLAVLAATRLGAGPVWWAAALGAAGAAAIGCRPQYAVAVVPVFLALIAIRGDRRMKLAGLVSFTAVCLAWLVPLVTATGGPAGFVEYQTGQAAYVAAHDAHLSRGTRNWVEIVLRFVAHPWGPKELALPTLVFAAAGAVELVRRRIVAAWPLVALSAIHLVFTVATSDPADGVRYQLPAQMAVALAAALGIDALGRATRAPRGAMLVPLVLLVGYWIYARPVVVPRATEPSPPARAVEWAKANLPRGAVVVWDPPLRPHAEVELRQFATMAAEPGLAKFWNDPATPLWVFADGATTVRGAQSFSWPYSDAYGKLTRNHYRVVSMIPLAPGRRYLPLKGVYPWERDARRSEWRWLDQTASLRLPPGSGDLVLAFGLPAEVPYERSALTVKVDGRVAATLTLERGGAGRVVVAVPDARTVDVDIVSSEAFTPAAGEGRDPRRLAVTLTGLERAAPPGTGESR